MSATDFNSKPDNILQQKADELYPFTPKRKFIHAEDYPCHVLKVKSERLAWVAGCAFRSGEAVRFVDWVRKYAYEAGGTWRLFSEALEDSVTVYTESQLYEQFEIDERKKLENGTT